jgi:hypothetical protein
MANKNQLKTSSLKFIEKENEKNKKLRQGEIDTIKHNLKLIRIRILHNLLTYIFLIFYIFACFYYGNIEFNEDLTLIKILNSLGYKEATKQSGLVLFEYLLIQICDKLRK